MRRLFVALAVLSVVTIALPAAGNGIPNEGANGIKTIEVADGGFSGVCPGTSTELDVAISGYYMSRWDTLTGQVFAIENVNIDWVFTNPDSDSWTFRERGVSVVREGDDMLIVSNNGHHNHWEFGAHVGHRVFTTTADGSVHIEEVLEAGLALSNVFDEACSRLAS